MDDLIVSTMPIKPQKNTSYGMLIAPNISELVSKKLNIKSILSVNLIHSYEDKNDDLDIYVNSIRKFGIKFDDIFIDKNNIDKIKQIIYTLIRNNYIVERTNTVLRCNCGKIDIIKDGIRDYDSGDLYYRKDNHIYCKKCNSKCMEYNEKQLYLYLDPNIDDTVKIIPNYLQSDFKHFYNTMPGNYILISKLRKTCCSININNNIYNIDNDFIWMNYIKLFNEDKQILIASNHQLYEMYILNYLNSICFNKDLYFIATPYMNKTNIDLENQFSLCEDEYFKKICLLYQLKWRNKNCSYDIGIFKRIKKLDYENRTKLYNYLYNYNSNINNDNIEKYLNDLFIGDINIQRNINDYKNKTLIFK